METKLPTHAHIGYIEFVGYSITISCSECSQRARDVSGWQCPQMQLMHGNTGQPLTLCCRLGSFLHFALSASVFSHPRCPSIIPSSAIHLSLPLLPPIVHAVVLPAV